MLRIVAREVEVAGQLGERLVFAATGVDASRSSAAGLLERVASLLVCGAITAEVAAPQRNMGRAGRTAEERRGEEAPDAPLVQTDWIGLELLGAEGCPVAWEPHVLELPDGRQLRGRLGADGTAVVRGIPSGVCKIRFPQRGAATWGRAQS